MQTVIAVLNPRLTQNTQTDLLDATVQQGPLQVTGPRLRTKCLKTFLSVALAVALCLEGRTSLSHSLLHKVVTHRHAHTDNHVSLIHTSHRQDASSFECMKGVCIMNQSPNLEKKETQKKECCVSFDSCIEE